MNGFSDNPDHKYIVIAQENDHRMFIYVVVAVGHCISLQDILILDILSLPFPSCLQVSASNSCNGTTNRHFYASKTDSELLKWPASGSRSSQVNLRNILLNVCID